EAAAHAAVDTLAKRGEEVIVRVLDAHAAGNGTGTAVVAALGWSGMCKGHKGKPTLILEAVATQDLRIWHAFFGLPGSHNDINVLHRSPVFDDLANGRTPEIEFWVNGNPYTMGYYLADGIYPDWATL